MLGSIDRTLFHYIGHKNNTSVINEYKLDKGLIRDLPNYSNDILRELCLTNFDKDCFKEAKRVLIELAENDLVTDTELLMDALNLHEFFEKDALYGITYYGINKYEHALIYIISLIDNSVIMQGKLDIKDVFTTCFPLGFYNDNACDLIIDKLISGNTLTQSHIYHKGMSMRH